MKAGAGIGQDGISVYILVLKHSEEHLVEIVVGLVNKSLSTGNVLPFIKMAPVLKSAPANDR